MADETYERVKAEFVALCKAYAPTLSLMQIERWKNAAGEFDALVASGRFSQIAIHDNVLLMKSRMVYMFGRDDVWHRIGEYLIDIRRDCFHTYNVTHTMQNYHGPHINTYGSVCMSTGEEEIMGLIKHGKLADAALNIEQLLWWNRDPKVFSYRGQFGDSEVEKWPVAELGEIPWITNKTAR